MPFSETAPCRSLVICLALFHAAAVSACGAESFEIEVSETAGVQRFGYPGAITYFPTSPNGWIR